jgi:hypothetical protein
MVWLMAQPAFAGLLQVPVIGLHVPTAWHSSWAVQVTESVPTQTPAWHLSVWVQRLPSSQSVPVFGVSTHWPVAGLQVPASLH